MNYSADNSVLMSRTAAKSMMSMNEVKSDVVMLLSWLFSLFIQCNLVLSALIELNS